MPNQINEVVVGRARPPGAPHRIDPTDGPAVRPYHRLLRKSSVLILLLFAITTLGWTADWPQWHGPNRDNISKETGLLTVWPAAGPPLLWEATHLGGGFAGVAVVADKVFTSGDFTNGASVLALDVKSGKPLWQSPLGKIGGGNGYPGPRATPTVDGKFVYALGQ